MEGSSLRNSNAHSVCWLLEGDVLGATVGGGLVVAFVRVDSDHNVKAGGLVSEIISVGYSEAVAAVCQQIDYGSMTAVQPAGQQLPLRSRGGLRKAQHH
jgi:hypothetical protein